MERSIVYYTDSKLDKDLDTAVRTQLLIAAGDIPIISVSQKPLNFGKNICVGEKPASYRSIYEQVLVGLEAAEGRIVNLCEHDVFYDSSHFEFIPLEPDGIYFNLNRYFWSRGLDIFRMAGGKRALSQAIAHRDILINNVKRHIYTSDVGPHMRCVLNRRKIKNWTSTYPNIDMVHDKNFTEKFRGKNGSGYYTVAGWGKTDEFSKMVGY
jgi:hypothetical protein